MLKPAARVGDSHTCPQFNGPQPHVEPIQPPGAPKVRIGGQPAARPGDTYLCMVPPDVIATGSARVKINGQPAARMVTPPLMAELSPRVSHLCGLGKKTGQILPTRGV